MTEQDLLGKRCLEGIVNYCVMKPERQLELVCHHATVLDGQQMVDLSVQISEPIDLGTNSRFTFQQLFELETFTQPLCASIFLPVNGDDNICCEQLCVESCLAHNKYAQCQILDSSICIFYFSGQKKSGEVDRAFFLNRAQYRS